MDRALLDAVSTLRFHLEASKGYAKVTIVVGFHLISGDSTEQVLRGVLTPQKVTIDYQDGCLLAAVLCPQLGPLENLSNGEFFKYPIHLYREFPLATGST